MLFISTRLFFSVISLSFLRHSFSPELAQGIIFSNYLSNFHAVYNRRLKKTLLVYCFNFKSAGGPDKYSNLKRCNYTYIMTAIDQN